MMRNVYLQGELGEKFGSKFRMQAKDNAEILKCLDANRPELKKYLIQCVENDIGFHIEHQGALIEQDNVLLPLKEGDVTISIIPAGSKSAFGKILAAVILYFVIGPWAEAAMIKAEVAAATITKVGTAISTLSVNLALQGVMQLMAPDPSVDNDGPENYAFNGGAQNIKPGDPVPVLYGELRVPGRPISMDVNNTGYGRYAGTIMTGMGIVIPVTTQINNTTGNDQTRDTRSMR
jgi:predicted phage tail protein